jgi:hypothetical protein
VMTAKNALAGLDGTLDPELVVNPSVLKGSAPASSEHWFRQRLAQFLQEVGRPIAATHKPETIEDLAPFLAHFEAVSVKYGYWNATPEENAAVGIHF